MLFQDKADKAHNSSRVGEIVLLETGHLDGGKSEILPAVVVYELQTSNPVKELTVASMSTDVDQHADDPCAVIVDASDLDAGGLDKKSVIRTDKLNTVSELLCKQTCIAKLNQAKIGEMLKTAMKKVVSTYYQAIHRPTQTTPFNPGHSRINYAGRVFDEQEMLNLTDSALDFWLTTGKYAQRFENEFARTFNVKHCSLVNSGSSANLLALMALTSPRLGNRRIRPGDEIITVAAGFPTTVAPILQIGAVPVFVDIRLPDANINPDLLEQALTHKTKAVILAHTLGFPFDLAKIKSFCNQSNLWLIEDNCDALGARYRLDGEWHYTGTIGHIGTSSFYPPHHMTMGEGGAVYTNDSQLKRLVESFRDWGRDCWCSSGQDNSCKKRFEKQFGTLPFGYDHKYVYSHFGYNLKITDLQAAVGCAQLEKIMSFIALRKQNHRHLYCGLEGLSRVFHLPGTLRNSDPSPFGFLVVLKDGISFARNEMTAYLESRNIQTRNLFAGNITRHPCFEHLEEGKDYRIVGDLKVTDKIMHDAFWLGVFPGMSGQMLDFMIQAIRMFVRDKN